MYKKLIMTWFRWKVSVLMIVVRFVCLLLKLSGLPWILREVYARNKITIINYHNPDTNVFASHAKFFVRHYSLVSIGQVIDALAIRTFAGLPPKPLLITFDDGYVGNATLFNVIQRYKVPAVIYAVAGTAGTNRQFWFDQLSHYGAAMKLLKGVSDDERRSRLRSEYNHWDEKEYESRVVLSADELKEFVRLGGTVGSHSVYHPLLDRCREDVGIFECSESRDLLELMTGSPVRDFALPNGNGNDRVIEWIKHSGYRSCRTTNYGWVTPVTSPYHLPVFGITDTADVVKVELQACGLWSVLAKISGSNSV